MLHGNLKRLRVELDLGKTEKGLCNGYAFMLLQAFLVDEAMQKAGEIITQGDFTQLEKFNNRMIVLNDYINQHGVAALKQLVETVREKLKSEIHRQTQKTLSENDWDILEFAAVMDGMELFENASSHEEIKRGLTQSQIEVIAEYVASNALKKYGGVVHIASWSGAYTYDELQHYLALIARIAIQLKCNQGIFLSSADHVIDLFYDWYHQEWLLGDINEFPHPNFEKMEIDRLAAAIFDAFDDPLGEDKTGNTLFTTRFYTAGNKREELSAFVKTLHADPEFIDLHNLNKTATRINDRAESLCFLAAQEGNSDLLNTLTQLKDKDGKYIVNFNQARVTGETPAYIAAQNGHTDIIHILGQLQDIAGNPIVDFNRAKDTGATPAYIAAIAGHTNIIHALASLKAKDGSMLIDIHRRHPNGKTPAMAAILFNQVEVFKALVNIKNLDGSSILNQGLPDGKTLVHVAAEWGRIEILAYLNSQHADLEVEVDGIKPIDLAKKYGETKVIQFYQELEQEKSKSKKLKKRTPRHSFYASNDQNFPDDTKHPTTGVIKKSKLG